jgi:cytochrome P450
MNLTASVQTIPVPARSEWNNDLWAMLIGLLVSVLASHQLGLLDLLRKTAWKHYDAFKFLLSGTAMIQSRYEESKGRPFEVFAPDNRYVFVSSQKHIKELDSAPDTVLSLQAASKQMLQPIYTMSRFNWFNVRGTEGVGFVRTLRTLLTNNLPNILPHLARLNAAQFASALEREAVVDGAIQCRVYPMIVDMVVLSNAVSFFGANLAKDEAFLKRAREYIEETLICAEIIRLVPRPFAPLIGAIVNRYFSSQDAIYDTLISVAEQRCREREDAFLGRPVPKHSDCIQWIMETSPRQKPWTASRVVHELMAIWFGSVHALSTTIVFAVHDLCLRPEYMAPLRHELDENYLEFERTGRGLDLLDSFIKESARLTPVEASKSIYTGASLTLSLRDDRIDTACSEHPTFSSEAFRILRRHQAQCWRLGLHARAFNDAGPHGLPRSSIFQRLPIRRSCLR